jgi:pimeloyl-ACP methyl ester carboxylesterase
MKPNRKHTAPININEHVINCLGAEVHYWTFNDSQKKTILMLHGFSGNYRGLLPFIERLGEFRIVAPDLPGFGSSTPMVDQPHTIAGYSKCVAEFIKKLGLKQPIIFGHSFGTVIGARLAVEHPDLIADKMVLVSAASVSPLKKPSARYVKSKLGSLHYWLAVNLPLGVKEKWAKSHTLSRIGTNDLVRTKDSAMRRAIYQHHIDDLDFLHYPDVFYQAYQSLSQQGVIDYAPRIAQEVLVIAGTEDSMWPESTQEQLAASLTKAKLVLLPNIGHLTHFEAPDAVCKLTKDFINS